jgi:DNA adenine methylase
MTKLGLKVYAADKFYSLVCFWNQLAYHNDELCKRVSQFLPTVSKEQYLEMQEEITNLTDKLDIAAYFFVLNRCSFSGNVAGGFTSYGMKITSRNPRFNDNSVKSLSEFRSFDTSKFRVKKLSFEDTLKLPADKFTYLDPPYIIKDKIYGNRGDSLHEINHVMLQQLLSRRKGPWLLSYNNCDIIKDLYKDYTIIDDIEWQYGMSYNKNSKELLILSKELQDSLGM